MITDVYKVTYQYNHDRYLGLLRNEKRFNIGDIVFVGFVDTIFKTRIYGVTLTDSLDAPEFIYKIELPREVAVDWDDNFIEVICDRMFNTIEEAKESALKQAEKFYKLEVNKINQFFKQYESK
jgi:hypothetical protein